nr:IQ domain-containing protein IQM4-like [Populus alba]
MESVASETVDDTLIVNGTSSSQEKAEISATYSWSHSRERDHAAATRIQKHYRGFRTRRNLADSIIAVELLWQTTLSRTPNTDVDVYIESEKHILSLLKWAETRVEKCGKNLSRGQLALLHCWETIDPRRRYSQNSYFFNLIWGDQCFLGSWKFDSNKIRDLKRSGESLFTTGKPTSVELRMDTTSSTQNWISELTKTWTTWKGALPRWLEVIDPRHRVGRNLNFYFQKWMTSSGGQPFFYWLDVGDGKTVNHPECSREKLRQERNTYLELVRKSWQVKPNAEGLK